MSGPNACRGSTKDARTCICTNNQLDAIGGFRGGSGLALPAFLHSLRKEVGKGLLIPNGMVNLEDNDAFGHRGTRAIKHRKISASVRPFEVLSHPDFSTR